MTTDSCPPPECEALRQRVAELEGELEQSRETNRRLNRRCQTLERQVRRVPSQQAIWRYHGLNNYYRRKFNELWEETQKLKAELEGEVREARAKALKEAAKLCEQHSRFYELHPEAAAIDPVEFQGAYSTGALKCAQIIREHQAEAGKETEG
jgi:chromosome segregation ATPase